MHVLKTLEFYDILLRKWDIVCPRVKTANFNGGFMDIERLIRFRPDPAMSDATSVHVYQEISVDGYTWISISSFFITKKQFEDLEEKLEEYFNA